MAQTLSVSWRPAALLQDGFYVCCRWWCVLMVWINETLPAACLSTTTGFYEWMTEMTFFTFVILVQQENVTKTFPTLVLKKKSNHDYRHRKDPEGLSHFIYLFHTFETFVQGQCLSLFDRSSGCEAASVLWTRLNPNGQFLPNPNVVCALSSTLLRPDTVNCTFPLPPHPLMRARVWLAESSSLVHQGLNFLGRVKSQNVLFHMKQSMDAIVSLCISCLVPSSLFPSF